MNSFWKLLGFDEQKTESNTSNTTNFSNSIVDKQQQQQQQQAAQSIMLPSKPPLPKIHHYRPYAHESAYLHPPSILETHESIFRDLASSSLISGNPNDFCKDWTLMFSTHEHGRSFPRFVSAIGRVKGPTLIIIQEEDVASTNSSTTTTAPGSEEEKVETVTSGNKNDDQEQKQSNSTVRQLQEGNIFGCITFTTWDNVRTRELNAKAANAAKQRAERTGVAVKSNEQYSSNKPSATTSATLQQAPQFFGTDKCVIFKCNNVNSTTTTTSTTTEFFHPRPSSSSLANANFMYFFDTHPNSSAVGFGVGGNGARSCVGNEAGMSFFVDRSLARGESCTGGCATFQYCNEQLCKNPDGKYKIKRMEVWALNPETIEREFDGHHQIDDDGNVVLTGDDSKVNAVGFSSPMLHNPKHATAKAMMELNGAKLWTENSEREDV